jgi:hypothetical protein
MLPAGVSFYYTALANPLRPGRDRPTDFYQLCDRHLRLPGGCLGNPAVADGHMILGFDATMAMTESAFRVFAARRAAESGRSAAAAITPGEVLGQLQHFREPDGATGPVDFSADDTRDSRSVNRKVTVVRVCPTRSAADQRAEVVPVSAARVGCGLR